MKSRILVTKSLEFDSPSAIPCQLWTLPWAEKHHRSMLKQIKQAYPDDIVNAPTLYKQKIATNGDPYKKGIYVDEWGCKFTNIHEGVIGQVLEPVFSDWDQLDRFKPPEKVLDIDKEEINNFCFQCDTFVLSAAAIRPFERLGFVRTMQQALMDLVISPSETKHLLTIIHQHYLKEVDAWSDTAVDAICLMDDWGSQQGLLISPVLWRNIFKPMYREYSEIARQRGKYVFMHSDGFILDIIPDLIEVGIQALNSQIHCMGIPSLGQQFRGKITFWGEIDRQHLLSAGSPGDIRNAVQEVWEHLYQDGGVIGQCEFGPGAKPENVYQVFSAWDSISREKLQGN